MAEYIEREAAIDCLHFVCVPQCRQYAQEEIKKIPAADVRPVVRGKWVKNGWSIRCSVCGYDMPFATRNFCPNCGAMMEEADETVSE